MLHDPTRHVIQATCRLQYKVLTPHCLPKPRSNALKGRSLLSGNSSGNILSCDPDNGGTFLRTGPDGMGGLVTVRQASNVGFGATKRPAPNAHGVNPDAKKRKEQVPVKRATAVDAANFFGVAKQS
jgi:hypothetical protein